MAWPVYICWTARSLPLHEHNSRKQAIMYPYEPFDKPCIRILIFHICISYSSHTPTFSYILVWTFRGCISVLHRWCSLTASSSSLFEPVWHVPSLLKSQHKPTCTSGNHFWQHISTMYRCCCCLSFPNAHRYPPNPDRGFIKFWTSRARISRIWQRDFTTASRTSPSDRTGWQSRNVIPSMDKIPDIPWGQWIMQCWSCGTGQSGLSGCTVAQVFQQAFCCCYKP